MLTLALVWPAATTDLLSRLTKLKSHWLVSMSNKSKSLSMPATHWEPKFPFDLVVGYADNVTRNRALVLYDRLAQQLLDEYDFQCAWWKFDHLRDESLLAQAIDDAAEANMIMLSISARSDLPPVAKTWIEGWASNKIPGKSALVALVDMAGQPAQAPCPVQSYLQQVARRASMDLFFHATDAGKVTHVPTAENLVQRAQTVTPLLQQILHRKDSVPRLTLN